MFYKLETSVKVMDKLLVILSNLVVDTFIKRPTMTLQKS